MCLAPCLWRRGRDIWISFAGTNFGTFAEAVQVTFHSENACLLTANADTQGPPGKVADTLVTCRVSGKLVIGEYPISISVGGQLAPTPSPYYDSVIVPQPPIAGAGASLNAHDACVVAN